MTSNKLRAKIKRYLRNHYEERNEILASLEYLFGESAWIYLDGEESIITYLINCYDRISISEPLFCLIERYEETYYREEELEEVYA